MKPDLTETMRAVVLDRFGGLDELKVREIPTPRPGAGQLLIRVEAAGVGVWDPWEREGGFQEESGVPASFPYVLGSEGAGEVVAVGQGADRYQVGDRVYAMGFLNPSGGFYAEYVALDQGFAARIPAGLDGTQAAVLAGDGITALRGLEDVLQLAPGESLLVFGAGGGLGHLAVQLAKRKGARVFAVASGEDGVALSRRLGADAVVEGKRGDVVSAARAFAPTGIDAALLTAGGEVADRVLGTLRDGARVAYPNGVEPVPTQRPGLAIEAYNGEPDADVLERLNRLVDAGTFHVEVARTFPLEEAAAAHRFLETHYLGKLALRIRAP